MVVLYHPKVKSEDLPRLSPEIRGRIEKAINERLLNEPTKYGSPLRKSLRGYWKLRVGDWRVVYALKREEVRIIIIGHRKDIYARVKVRFS